MAEKFQEVFQLVFDTLGEDKARALQQILREVGDAGGQADEKLAPLVEELRSVGEQQAAVKLFGELSTQQAALADSADAAGLKLKLLNEQQIESARVLEQRNQELAAATAAQTAYNATADRTAEGAKKLSDAVRQAATAQKEANTEYTASTQALDAASRDYDKVATAQDKVVAKLDPLAAQLKAAGVASNDLGKAQADLAARGAQAAQGLETIATSLRAEQQAAQSLAQAHQALGTRPFGDIAADIAKVRAAYDTLKQSGTMSVQALAQANARMSEQVRELQAQTNGWAQSLNKVKFAVMPAIAGLYGLGRVLADSARVSSEFQTSIARVSTLLKDDSGIPQITESVKAMAREFGGSASTQAKAFYDVLSAGYEKASDASHVLDASNKLAIGGVTDLGIATGGLVSVLKAYGLASDQATRVADAYFTAAKGGATSVADLAQSVGQVAPQAALAKIPIETLSAAIGALTNGGIKTSDAVTQISSVLQAVIKPSDEAAQKARELGINFSLAALQSQGLQKFLNGLQEATKGNANDMAVLFGRVDGLRGALSLIGPLAGDFGKILGDMSHSAGATSEAFDKLKNTPEQQMKRFQAALDEVRISLGGLVTGTAPLLEMLSGLLRAFSDLPAGVQSTVFALIGAGTATKLFISIIGQLGPALRLLTANFAGLVPAAVSASGSVATLGRALAALPTALTIAVSVAGILEATGALDVLAGAYMSLSGQQQKQLDAEAEQRASMVESLDHISRVVAKYREFADVQVLSAVEVTKLGLAERDAYQTRLAGLQKFLQARTAYLQGESRLRELSQSEAEELARTKAALTEVRAGYVALTESLAIATRMLADKITPAAAKAAMDLERLGISGRDSAKVIADAFKDINLNDKLQVGTFVLAMESIGEKSKELAKTIQAGLGEQIKKLSGEDLLKFQSDAVTAFDSVGRKGAATAVVLDTTLRAAMALLHVDAARTGEAFTDAGKQTIAAFTAVADNARATAPQIAAAFDAALASVKTTDEARRLGEVLESAMRRGAIGAQQAGEEMQRLRDRVLELRAEAGPLAADFEQLGIKSKASLDAAAQAAKTAYENIINGAREGKAAQEDVQAAFDVYAQRVLASVATSTAAIKEQTASQLETRAAIDNVSNAVVKSAAVTGDAAKKTTASTKQAGAATKDMGDQAKEAGKAFEATGDQAKEATDKAKKGASDTGGLMQVLTSALANARAGFVAISEAAAKAFDSTLLSDFFSTFDSTGAGVSRVLDAMASATKRVTEQIAAQREQLRGMIASTALVGTQSVEDFSRFGAAAGMARDQIVATIESIKAGTYNAGLLGKEDLAPYLQALEAAKQRVDALTAAEKQATAQLDELNQRLQDQLDEAAGNKKALEDRDFARQKKHIEELAAKADAAGKAEAEEALRRLNELHQEKLRKLEEEQRAQKQSNDANARGSSGGASASGGSSSAAAAGAGGVAGSLPGALGGGDVVINLHSTVTDPRTLDDFARQIKARLDAIGRMSQ